jgi:hypothetical protein
MKNKKELNESQKRLPVIKELIDLINEDFFKSYFKNYKITETDKEIVLQFLEMRQIELESTDYGY